MRWSGGTTRGPIGIDLGSRAIKAAQLSLGGERPRVTAAMAIPRLKDGGALEREEVRRLAEVLFRQGFEGNRVVVAAPNESLLVGTLSLPPKQSGAPLDQIARLELARMHKQEPMSFELTQWELPATAAGQGGKVATTSVMAAACPHREAEALLDLIESADFEVVGLDVQWLALARACAPMFAPPEGDAPTTSADIAAIVDLGWRAARIIVLRHGVVVFERLLTEGGLCKLRDTLKAQLQLDDDATEFLLRDVGCSPPRDTGDRRADPTRERGDRRDTGDDEFKEPRRLISAHFAALKEELQVSLSYAMQQFRGEGVAKLALTGGGGAIPGLAVHLAEAIGFKVEPADMTRLAQCPRGLDRLAASTVVTTALGLAMYAA
jgi:Tfp pilus assembly PilM family ATPase